MIADRFLRITMVDKFHAARLREVAAVGWRVA